MIPIYSARPDQVKKALKYVYCAAISKLEGKELELLIAILPDNNGSLYGMHLAFASRDLCVSQHYITWDLPSLWLLQTLCYEMPSIIRLFMSSESS